MTPPQEQVTGTGSPYPAADQPRDATFYASVLPMVMSPQSVAEHKATAPIGAGFSDLLVSDHQ